ncbi:MAG: hypothetical protein ACW97Z_13415 [Candidatus Hodarchaeales archaeon]
MQVSKNNKRIIVQVSVVIAIPLILLALVFLISVGIRNEQADWFYSIGDVAGAIYFRERAELDLFYTIVFGGIALILLVIAFFVKREY